MAINAIVFYSPDKTLRITADTNNRAYRVERNLVFVAEFSSLSTLESWLNEQGLSLADLIQD